MSAAAISRLGGPRVTHVSLFTGVGMLDLAAQQEGFETIATAEVDPWCRSLLKQRFPDAFHFPDVQRLDSRDLRSMTGFLGAVDLLSGGFPCQDASDSGTKLGLSGARTGLWLEMLRVINELRPRFVIGENVASLRSRGLGTILCDLYAADYDVRWECIPAAYVGAPHLRDRVWIMARRRDMALAPAFDHPGTESLGLIWAAGAERAFSKLPRAGRVVSGHVYATKPLTTLKDARNGRALLPTPTKSDGTGGPGTTPRRTGGKNLRTVVAERCGNGRLNPVFVEWMMGLPLHWTDTSSSPGAVYGWDWSSPYGLPYTLSNLSWTTNKRLPDRSQRIQALGNGLVPQVARVALRILLND